MSLIPKKNYVSKISSNSFKLSHAYLKRKRKNENKIINLIQKIQPPIQIDILITHETNIF